MCDSHFSSGENNHDTHFTPADRNSYFNKVPKTTDFNRVSNLIALQKNYEVKDTQCVCVSKHKLFKLCCHHLLS